MKKSLFLLLMLLAFNNVNAQISAKVYSDENIEAIVQKHKTIAILPMDVTIRDTQKKEKNRMSSEEMEEMATTYQKGFQNSMYSWFLKMKKKGRLSQDIQDVTRTNAILAKNGINSVEDILLTPPEDIAELLGVDALFTGSIISTRSFNKGGAVALAVFTGIAVRTGDADVMIKLYNSGDGKMIWSFDRTVASSYASDPEKIVDYLMKRVSKRFPYKK